MWKFIILAACGYVVFKLFTGDMRRKAQSMEAERRREQERMAQAGEMVKDPICGTYVQPDTALTVRDGSTTWHFCSYECRDEFLKRLQSGSSQGSQQS